MKTMRKYLFWLFVDHNCDWWVWWMNIDLDGFLKFRKWYFLNKTIKYWVETPSFKDVKNELEFYLDEYLDDEFEARYEIWLKKKNGNNTLQ